MLLSIKYNFLFIHIAKTGGTSIRSALTFRKWTDPYQIPLFICGKLSGMTNHRLGVKFPRHAKVVAAKEMLPREVFENLFKFAFVRNPWDLQVSSYHHIRRERPHLMGGIDDFESFLRWKLDSARPYNYIIDTSMQRQVDYVVDLAGNVIVDFVGRYENLQEGFDEACKRVGIPRRILPHKREAGDRGDYRTYYTEETAGLIADYFKRDIETFGYSFDGG